MDADLPAARVPGLGTGRQQTSQRDRTATDGRARPSPRGRSLAGTGTPATRPGVASRSWDPNPRRFGPAGEVKVNRPGAERGNGREPATTDTSPEDRSEPPGDASRGPCFACGQMGHFRRDCPFMECDVASGAAGDGRPPRRPPPLLCKVRLGARELTALIDSGSAVSMIRSHLIPADQPTHRWASVICLHRHTQRLPVVRLQLGYLGTRHQVDLARMEDLPYPVLLGRDAPLFRQLLVEHQGEELLMGLPIEEGDPEEGPSGTAGAAREEREGPVSVGPDDPPQLLPTGSLQQAQEQDPSLTSLRDDTAVEEGQVRDQRRAQRVPRVERVDGLWWRIDCPPGGATERKQLVVPQQHRTEVLRWAHDSPWAGHQGHRATRERVLRHFFWPTVDADIRQYCRLCAACQRGNNRDPPRVPLCSIPSVGTPFEQIAMDFIGPLPRTSRGHRFALVIMDYATRFPEAFPLRGMQAMEVARHLIRLFARVGLPRSILTDQGKPFTSGLMRAMCRALGIRQRFTAIYHPQTDGLVERFNQTLKTMIRKVADEHPSRWDTCLDAVLFAVRETPQASTGLAPFELLYGRRPRGLMEVLRDQWAPLPAATPQAIAEYMGDLRQTLDVAKAVAQRNLDRAQEQQQTTYNRTARHRTFQVGDQVLV